MLSILHPHDFCAAGTIISPILQIRKPRHRRAKSHSWRVMEADALGSLPHHQPAPGGICSQTLDMSRVSLACGGMLSPQGQTGQKNEGRIPASSLYKPLSITSGQFCRLLGMCCRASPAGLGSSCPQQLPAHERDFSSRGGPGSNQLQLCTQIPPLPSASLLFSTCPPPQPFNIVSQGQAIISIS